MPCMVNVSDLHTNPLEVQYSEVRQEMNDIVPVAWLMHDWVTQQAVCIRSNIIMIQVRRDIRNQTTTETGYIRLAKG